VTPRALTKSTEKIPVKKEKFVNNCITIRLPAPIIVIIGSHFARSLT
jgi:hypothetical protein